MKKSHRKDVIIVRIIFAVVCILLIAVIVGAVLFIRGQRKEDKDDSESQATVETEGNQPHGADDVSGNTQASEPVTPPEDTQPVELNPIMRTTTGVNMRAEPNTGGEVITVLEPGTMLEMLGEEAGWAAVEYQGQIGYVSLDYLEEVTGDDTGQGAGTGTE